MSADKRTKLEQKEITFASGQSGNKTTTDIVFEKQFDNIKSVRLIEIAAGGLSNYNVGIRDASSSVDLIEAVDSNHLKAGADRTAQPIGYKNYGQKFEIKTELPAATSSELKYKLVFELEKTEQ